MTVKWKFTDYWGAGAPPYSYTWEINPNDGGSPEITKNITVMQNVGPNRVGLVMEGQSTIPVISFSGVILTQSHYEAMEYWFDRRVFLRLDDDLDRVFYGVFSKFSPKRARRASHPWYHTYDASFHASGYENGSSQPVYGRVL